MTRGSSRTGRWVFLAFLVGARLGAGSAERAAEYAKLVEEYRKGNGDPAIRQLLSWEAATMAEAVRDAALPSRSFPLLYAPDFPAAIMLHTEAGLRLNSEGRGFEAAFQWLLEREQDAVVLLEQGHEQFPDDPLIALDLGRANEVLGSYADGVRPSAWANRSADARQYLTTAESCYRGALALDAGLIEARLRLGRVLQMTRRREAALALLRRVTEPSVPAHLRYLAHLFIADQLLHVDGEVDPAAAQRELERALELWPRGQAAALSLSRILHSNGRRAEAALVLERAIAGKEQGSIDPFRTYHSGDRTEERPLRRRPRRWPKPYLMPATCRSTS
jgi:tetratricopeptide (TPR) repeat protein